MEHDEEKHKKYSRGEVAKIILKALLVGGAVVLVLSSPRAAQIITNYLKGDRRKFTRAVGHLKESKYVNAYYKGGEEVIEITEKGKKRSLQYDFEDMKIERRKKRDGIWRIVTFDISEKRKRGRDQFVAKLKELGFYPYQKSIFIFPFECKDEIDFMKEHLFLGDSIRYIEASFVDGEEDLKKKFNI
jgi:DNA-binding transcriptional regulator PaaX